MYEDVAVKPLIVPFVQYRIAEDLVAFTEFRAESDPNMRGVFLHRNSVSYQRHMVHTQTVGHTFFLRKHGIGIKLTSELKR